MKIYKHKFIFAAVFFLLFLCPFTVKIYAAETGNEHGMLDNMMILVLQLGVIIFMAYFGGILFEKLHLPGILGELVAGMLIGPYCLGSIHLPILGQPLFALHDGFPISPELYGFTTVASIILLFLVGIETDLSVFLKYSVEGAIVGLGGVIISFLFGDIITVLFSQYVFHASYGFWHPLPLFLGVVSTATSVGITARILSERKKMQSPEGVTIVSGAIIDDVLGIISLAIIIGIIKSGHVEWVKIGLISVKYVGLWLGFTILGLAASRYIGKFLKTLKNDTSIGIMGLGLALILAGIFECAGLAMIIGAYIMGLSLSRTDLNYMIREKLSSLYTFFVPAFFCVMGMLVDFSSMQSWSILLFGGVYTVASIAGKVIGCGLPVCFLNFNLRGALRVGLGMIPRGEVALIVTGIGMSTGILPKDALGVVIIMIFITTLLAPVLLSAALTSDKPVLRKETVAAKKEQQEISFTFPSMEATELVMSNVVSTFSKEGFYVYNLSMEDGLYQIRKDNISIGVQARASKLQFECKKEESAFVNILVYEVLAGLEDTMRKLQTVINKSSFRGRISDNQEESLIAQKDFAGYINPEAVEVDLQQDTKVGIIGEMINILIRSGQLKTINCQTALADILKREEIMSTGLQDGIALPHAKTDAVTRMVTAIGLKKSGVDFSSLDGQTSKIFVMVLTPRDVIRPYLKFMADITQLLINKRKQQAILASKTNKQLYNRLIAFNE